ncbi:MAG: YitT family protein [Oscillospiraceae bacterium]|nr:YitT family protein [Oscillospiraceae bacterium]
MKKSFQFLERIQILNIIMLTIAGMINAFGITVFLSPVKLYDSGISGTAMLLSQITSDFMSLSIFLLLLNTPLFLFGLKREGKLFTFYAIYAVIIYSVSAWLITDVLPIDVSFASPLAGTDLLLCALFGGLISGIGSGIALRFGGAMDGIEVLGVVFSKTLGISVGTFCMIYNVILYIICGCIIKSWILPLYSIVTYAAALKTVDFIVDGLDRAKGAMIITSCPWDICEALTQEFGSGMTVINAKGGYSNTDKAIIYFVIHRFQVTKMRSIVHEIDKMAYITISDVADVFPANHS